MDNRTSLVATVSEGQGLEGLPLTVLNLNRNDLRPEFRHATHLYGTLRPLGVGHAFYRGEIWLASLSGTTATECVEKVLPFFERTSTDRTIVKLDFKDDISWNRIAKPLVRDAIVFALEAKGNLEKGLLVRGPMVFSLTERKDGARKGTVVHSGLDFSRIHRAVGGNILVALALVIKAFDSTQARVRDPAVTSAYSHDADNRWGTMERICRDVLPLKVNLGDRKFEFKKLGVPIGPAGR